MCNFAAAAGLLALSAPAVALGDGEFRCPPSLPKPPVPQLATDYSGVVWPEFCFEPRGFEEHFFIIGDWGGIFRGSGVDPYPAPDSKGNTRHFVDGIDDRAQLLVAAQMKIRANVSQPRYLLNVGDNFYWGGVEASCGTVGEVLPHTIAQWQYVYERVYDGPDLLGKPWLGVLGNHDFGGYKFTMGWDQAIAYTWSESVGGTGRWLTPALYWRTTVRHEDFSIDYYFVDSNVNDAFMPLDLPGHNMCSLQNNPVNATCESSGGPSSPEDCTYWFAQLWADEIAWMDKNMADCEADWLIVVTHFPPEFRQETWKMLAEKHGIDLFVTGHRHQQEVAPRDPDLGGAATVVCGGGGGITSESPPSPDGMDDQYGFMDVRISKGEIYVESISHSGIVRLQLTVPAWRYSTTTTATTSTSTVTTRTSSTSTRTSTTNTTATTSSSTRTSTTRTTSTRTTSSRTSSTGTATSRTTADSTMPPETTTSESAAPASSPRVLSSDEHSAYDLPPESDFRTSGLSLWQASNELPRADATELSGARGRHGALVTLTAVALASLLPLLSRRQWY